MQFLSGQKIRCGIRIAACLAAMVVLAPSFTGNSQLLAQAPPPAPGQSPAPIPSNVTVPGRLYVMEGIVVVVLFAGAIFGVCRSSGRT
ncbi:MAG: hypothetical protein JSS49_14640 [Planctomycetes bacterium]|nr:hypothetical protein [Planctomycetota bacterium]